MLYENAQNKFCLIVSRVLLLEYQKVNKSIKKLKDKNLINEGFLDPPKGEQFKSWKKVKPKRLNNFIKKI